MIGLYRIVTRLVYLLVYPYARRRAGRGSGLWRGRLGQDLPPEPVDIWMHAASVGEVKVIANLVTHLRRLRSELKIHVTTITGTGLEAARRTLGDRTSVSAFPLDAVPPVSRTLERLAPKMIVVAETEIWPNLIRLAAGRNIPLVLVNGRMTERSLGKYKLVAASLRPLLATYDRFFFKSEPDRDRFLRLGASPSRAVVSGDMKFDAPVIPRSDEKVEALRRRLGIGPDDFMLVAGSTRPGEERLLLEAVAELKREYPRVRLVIAPRHLERLSEVEGLLARSGVAYHTYTGGEPGPGVTLVDCMGVLTDLYAAADLAFVGGTLVAVGGHNLLEPVWAQTPVVYGPSLSNVVEAAEYIERHRYGLRVASVDELVTVARELLDGRRTFAVRVEADLEHSASAAVANYILERIDHA